jgi:hypothetical protein
MKTKRGVLLKRYSSLFARFVSSDTEVARHRWISGDVAKNDRTIKNVAKYSGIS